MARTPRPAGVSVSVRSAGRLGPGSKPHGLCQASASRRRRASPTSVVRLIPGRPRARPALRGRSAPAGTLGRNLPGRQATLANRRRRRSFPTQSPSRLVLPVGRTDADNTGGPESVDGIQRASNEFKGLTENPSTFPRATRWRHQERLSQSSPPALCPAHPSSSGLAQSVFLPPPREKKARSGELRLIGMLRRQKPAISAVRLFPSTDGGRGM